MERLEPSDREKPDPATVRRLRKRLLAWYAEGKRELPWRATRDPYAIWISEAMLQQTRVETVIDYWKRFMQRFPDVRSLARATEEDVLAAWSGLGYYRRARGLRAAAQCIEEDHGGEFPRESEALLALPGVGPYTAGAVLSIAFDLSEPVVDGNVERVFCRHFGIDAAHGSSGLKRRLWELADRLVPARGGAGDWNQAVMELGATVCTPRKWRCEACPLASSCHARRSDLVADLPRPRPRPEVVEVELEIAVAIRRGRWLLEQRPAGGRMAGLWQFPSREASPGSGLSGGSGPGVLFPVHFPAPSTAAGPLDLLGSRSDGFLGELRHGITRHRIRAAVFRARLPSGVRIGPPYRWFSRAEVDGLALTGMARKVLAAPFLVPVLVQGRDRAPERSG